jgi:hypothetical protein
MFNGAKERMMRRTIAESDAMGAVAQIIAGLEVELLNEVQQLESAAGVEHIDSVPEQDERKETLLGLVQAKMGGDAGQFYLEEVASEHIEEPGDAKPYLSLSDEEWQQQIQTWADSYRAKGVSADLSDREIADQHVNRSFGVSLDEFERNVVQWDQGDMLKQVLAGNVQTAIEGVRTVRSELQEGGEV